MSPATPPNSMPAETNGPTTPATAPAHPLRPSQRPCKPRAERLFSRRSRRPHHRAKHALRAGCSLRRLFSTAVASTRATITPATFAQSQQPTSPAASSSCQTTVPVCPPAKPAPAVAPVKHKRPRKPALPQNEQSQHEQPTQTLGNAPIAATPQNLPPNAPPNPKHSPLSNRKPNPPPAPASPTRISSSKMSRRSAVPGFAFSARPLRRARAIWRAATSGHREWIQRLAWRNFAAELPQRRSRLLAACRDRVTL